MIENIDAFKNYYDIPLDVKNDVNNEKTVSIINYNGKYLNYILILLL